MPSRYQTIFLLIVAVVPPWLALVYVLFDSTHMDFLESMFGSAPDHGDGTLEAVLLVVFVAITTGTATAILFDERM
jgi:hypothetical protein